MIVIYRLWSTSEFNPEQDAKHSLEDGVGGTWFEEARTVPLF